MQFLELNIIRNQVFKRSLFLTKENDQFSADIGNEKSTEEDDCFLFDITSPRPVNTKSFQSFQHSIQGF